jgi:translocation and assembly module TamB
MASVALASSPARPRRPGGHGPGRIGILRWLAYVALGLVALVGLLMAGLNTEPGRRFVADRIAALEFANGLKIGIGQIDGSLYGRMTIRRFTLSDPKGQFLSSPEVEVEWRPLAYLNNHIDVRSLGAATVTLTRLPHFRATPPSDEPLLPDYDIDIGRLKVDRLIVEPAVTGQRQVTFIDGRAHIADRRAQIAMRAGAVPGAGRAGGDTIDLKLDAVPEDNRLALSLLLDAPRNGLLAKMAGIKAPLSMRIAGRGDWRAWDGRLSADLDRLPFARLRLEARSGTFTLRGPTRVARLFEGPTAALLGPITSVDLSSTWEDRRADLVGRIASDAFTLSANGRADLSSNRFEGLKLGFALLKPGAIAPNLSGRDLRAQLTLDGAFRQPRIAYNLSASVLAFNDMAVDGLHARGNARVDPDHAKVPVTASARRITGIDTLAGGQIANVRLDGNIAIDWPRILSDDLRIRSDRIDAKAIILADVAKGLYTGALEGRVNDYRIDSVGIFNLDTRADLKTLAGGGFSLVGRIRAQSTRLFNEGVRNFLGGNLTASTDFAYGPDGIIRLSRLRLTAPQLRVTDGRGSYSPTGAINLRASGVSRQYGPVGLQVTGTVSSPRAVVTAARPGLGLGIADLRAEIRAAGQAYRILASGRSDYGPFDADLLVRTAGPLTIEVSRASLAGINVQGRLRQAPAGPFVGRLDARGQGLGGVVRLAAAGRYQQLTINLRANNAVLPGPANLAVGAAIVDARIILYDRPEVIADAQIAQTRYGSLDIAAARALIDYRGGQGFARLLAEGSTGVPFRVAINSELHPDLWRAAVRGRVNGLDFQTSSPARILPRSGSYELLPTRLVFDRGNVRLAGIYGRTLRLQSRLDSLDMALINGFLPGMGIGGTATGSVDFELAGAGSMPRADARLAIRDFTRTTAASVSQPVDINFVGQLTPARGEARAVMRRRGTAIGRMQAFLQPLGPGAGAWTRRVGEAPVRGGIRYIGPADTIFSFAGLADQRLSGPLGLAADFGCRVSRPCLQGIVRGRNMTYENMTYGTRLTGMALAGRFTGERLEIEQLSATAGSGTVTGKGYVSLAAASGFPADFDLSLNNARLADSEALSATASGNVHLAKAAGGQPLLTGTVQLPATRYQIIRQGSARVPELTGVRFKPPRGRLRVTGDAAPQQAAGFGDVRLDLRIMAPSQLFVSGMGLESEWRADLKVTGTSKAPRVSGEVELVRGTLGFAGRSFTLREGRVAFSGGSASDAAITLRAEETIEEVAVTVAVDGSATNPRISFSSAPGLPQDEIVSRILFGSSVGNLSTIQAVQLAASLNSLRGSGGGLNPLGKLRAAAGVDRLRILGPDDTSGRGTALAAGKYISDDIYLEVVTDARGFTATQLEIALSRSLSILSQAGGSGTTNVKVRYRKTY